MKNCLYNNLLLSVYLSQPLKNTCPEKKREKKKDVEKKDRIKTDL